MANAYYTHPLITINTSRHPSEGWEPNLSMRRRRTLSLLLFVWTKK